MRSLAIQLLYVYFLCPRMTPLSTCAVSPTSCCMCTFSAAGRRRCQHAQSRHPAVVCVLSLSQDDAVVNMRSLAIQLLHVYFLCPRTMPLSTCAVSPSSCYMCTFSAPGRRRCQHAQSRHPAVTCVLPLSQDDAVVNMRSLAIQLLHVYFLCPRTMPWSTCAVSPSNCYMCTSSVPGRCRCQHAQSRHPAEGDGGGSRPHRRSSRSLPEVSRRGGRRFVLSHSCYFIPVCVLIAVNMD